MQNCFVCGTRLPLGATQCHECLEPVVEINGRAISAVGDERSPVRRDGFSRWRGGATNLGWPVRGAVTLFVGFAGWWVFASSRTFFAAVSSTNFGFWYALGAIPVTVLSLWRIWRPTRVRRDAPTARSF